MAPRELRTGLISGVTFDNKAITFEVVNGRAVFEGDIDLGPVDRIPPAGAHAPGGDELSPQILAATHRGVEGRWLGGVIPYTIDAGLPHPERVTQAIEHWQQRTCIRFVPRTTEGTYVTFVPVTGGLCSSPVGMPAYGQQRILLDDDCDRGNIIHEIGHTVGLFHEQSRVDRDWYVEILWNNLEEGFTPQFNQRLSDGDDVCPYDFGSVMHYPSNAFGRAIEGVDKHGAPQQLRTIRVKPDVSLDPARVTLPKFFRFLDGTMGQREGLSLGDTLAVETMYGTASPSVAVASDDGVTIAYRTRKGRIIAYLMTRSGFERLDVTADGTGPDALAKASSRPAVVATGTGGSTLIVFVRSDGMLRQATITGRTAGGTASPIPGSSVEARGNPSACADASGNVVIVFRDPTGRVSIIEFPNPTAAPIIDFRREDGTAYDAVGDPTAYFVGSVLHVVYVGLARGLVHLWRAGPRGTVWQKEIVPRSTATAIENPSLQYESFQQDSEFVPEPRMAFRGPTCLRFMTYLDGSWHPVWFDPSKPNVDPDGNLLFAMRGTPAMIHARNALYTTFREQDGSIGILWGSGPHYANSYSGTEHPSAVGDPVCYVMFDTVSCVFRGVDDHIHQVSWPKDGPNLLFPECHQDLTRNISESLGRPIEASPGA